MVPTRYGRQAILDEFGGLKMCSTSASIDSNRVVDAKFLLLYVLLFVYHTSPSFMYSCRSVHHTQSILLYGQAARAISIG